jgi:hypothetical protein
VVAATETAYLSAHNQDAPFYVWHDALAAAGFLWGGGGFAGIVCDFARPRVDTWRPVAVAEGEAPHPAVTAARLRTVTLPHDDDLTSQAERLRERVEASGREPGVHLACACIDPTRDDRYEPRFGCLARRRGPGGRGSQESQLPLKERSGDDHAGISF